MKLVNVRPTSPQIVTYPQVQAQLHIDNNDEEQLILDYTDAATEYAEQALDTSLLTRTITAIYFRHGGVVNLWTDHRIGNRIFLPRGPVQSITSVVDANGTAITDYILEAYGHADELVLRQNYITPLTITYSAGYGSTASAVPSDIRMAIRTHVASLWRNRESISDKAMLPVPHSLEAFYSKRRRTGPVA